MALPRYTLGTGKAKKKKKKPGSVRERIANMLGSNGNTKAPVVGPAPQMMFSPRMPRTTSSRPTSSRPTERYTRLHPEDRALLVEAIALLKRSIWGEPEIVSDDPEEQQEEETAEQEEEDTPVLREDEVEADQPA